MPKRIFIRDGGLTASNPTPAGYTVIGSENGQPKKQVESTISDLGGVNWVKVATFTKDDLNSTSNSEVITLFENVIPPNSIIGDILVKVTSTFSSTQTTIDGFNIRGLRYNSISGYPNENIFNLAFPTGPEGILYNPLVNQVVCSNNGSIMSNSNYITGLFVQTVMLDINYQDFTQGSLDIYLNLTPQI